VKQFTHNALLSLLELKTDTEQHIWNDFKATGV